MRQNDPPKTAAHTTVDTRTGAVGAVMAPHSMDNIATAIAIRTRNGQPPRAQPVSNQIAAKTRGMRMVAETARTPRFDQSKDFLACGKDVVRHSAAKPPFPFRKFRKGSREMLSIVVRPKNILEYKLRIGRFPEQEV